MSCFRVTDSGSLDRRGCRAGKSSPAVGLVGQRRPSKRGRLTCRHLGSPSDAATDSQTVKRHIFVMLRSMQFIQYVLYLSGSEVSLNITLLSVNLLGGRPANHMVPLGLQLRRPQSKFNLLVPSCFPLNCNLACHYLLLFLKDGAAACLHCETATLLHLYNSVLSCCLTDFNDQEFLGQATCLILLATDTEVQFYSQNK